MNNKDHLVGQLTIKTPGQQITIFQIDHRQVLLQHFHQRLLCGFLFSGDCGDLPPVVKYLSTVKDTRFNHTTATTPIRDWIEHLRNYK